EAPAERWPSGRRRSPAKGVDGQKLSRGFESLPLRHPHMTEPDQSRSGWRSRVAAVGNASAPFKRSASQRNDSAALSQVVQYGLVSGLLSLFCRCKNWSNLSKL